MIKLQGTNVYKQIGENCLFTVESNTTVLDCPENARATCLMANQFKPNSGIGCCSVRKSCQ